MTSATTRRSLRKLSARQAVVDLLDQRLLIRSAATQGVEANALGCQIHLGSNQTVLPPPFHSKRPTQQLHLSVRVAAAQEDQPPLRMCLQVQLPALRKAPPLRCGLDARGGTLPMRGHIACRLGPQALHGLVMEPRPDLGLPEAIEPLDRCL